MLGRLPRLHRWALILLSTLTGTGLAAWVSHRSLQTADYGCADVLLGVCAMPDVNLVSLLVGAASGAMVSVWLVHHPDTAHGLPLDHD